jgi:hypothetical protein
MTEAKEYYEKFRTTYFTIPALIPWDNLTESGQQRVVEQYLSKFNEN